MQETKKHVRVGIGVVVQDKNGNILLGRRNKDSKRGNDKLNIDWDWSLPGGGLEYGESFEECAIREVKEETNLDIKNPVQVCANNDRDDFAHWVTIGMFSANFSGTLITNEPDKYTEWRWFPPSSLPDRIFFPSAGVIEKFRRARMV